MSLLSPKNRTLTRLLAGLLVGTIVCAPGTAYAHNQQVHQDMVMVAYEIMRLSVRRSQLFTAPATLPPGISVADWERFQVDVSNATRRLPELEFDVDYNGRACQRWARLKDVDRVPRTNFLTGVGCPKWSKSWVPQGIYTANNQQGGVKDLTGATLGFLASNVDNGFDDSHLSMLPRNSAIVGPLADAIDTVLDVGIAAVLLPFVCGFMFLTGDFSCLSTLADLADAANPFDEIVDSISVGDSTGEDWVGIWHHIDVRSGVANEFDDHQGFFLEETGYRGQPDIVEQALQVVLDVEGLTLDPEMSLGRRYEQATAADFHPNTRWRSWSQWQAASIVHTPTLPLDNLALWGWSTYRAARGQKAAGLGWPLHALGDAVAPMHTIGSPAWGHRPFEIAVEQIWPEVRFVQNSAAEEQQAQRIFAEAVRFRKVILDWRRSHPLEKDDLPIRDLVTLVAQETLAYSDQKMVTDNWPFKRYASVVFHGTSMFDSFPGVPGEAEAIAMYAENGGADLVRPLIEKGSGAMIAFLTSAAEVR